MLIQVHINRKKKHKLSKNVEDLVPFSLVKRPPYILLNREVTDTNYSVVAQKTNNLSQMNSFKAVINLDQKQGTFTPEKTKPEPRQTSLKRL